jgi:hypothetical protein
MEKHGIIFHGMTDEEVVCPSDYIVTKRDGSFYRIPAREFDALYEATNST